MSVQNILCPYCGIEHKKPLTINLPSGDKEVHCNSCYRWFLITKDGKILKKSF
ncbi:hypothetical protein HRbin06_00966 [archaeon HR06]|nr:hypothetical protein HRbin06_00966 [archaeon HR06]